MGGYDNAIRAGWELRAGWRRGGPLLGRADLDGAQDSVAISLNARGQACVAARTCRAALTLVDPTVVNETGTSPLPLML